MINDDPPSAIAHVFDQSANAMSRGTWTSVEVPAYGLNNGQGTGISTWTGMMFAVKLKQLLLWEHPATNTLWIGRAMPRVWLAPGGMHNRIPIALGVLALQLLVQQLLAKNTGSCRPCLLSARLIISLCVVLMIIQRESSSGMRRPPTGDCSSRLSLPQQPTPFRWQTTLAKCQAPVQVSHQKRQRLSITSTSHSRSASRRIPLLVGLRCASARLATSQVRGLPRPLSVGKRSRRQRSTLQQRPCTSRRCQR